MAQADGSVILDTKMNNDALEKGFERLKSDAKSLGMTVEKTGKEIKLAFSEAETAPAIENAIARLRELQVKFAEISTDIQSAPARRNELTEQLADIDARADAAKQALYEMQNAAKGTYSTSQIAAVKDDVAMYTAQGRELESQIKRLDTETNRLGERSKSVYSQMQAAQRMVAQSVAVQANRKALAEEVAAQRAASAAVRAAAAEERAQVQATKAAEREAEKKKKAQKKAYKEATKGARKFSSRFSRLLSGALIFNALSSGLSQLTSYFNTALKNNSDFSSSFAQLKGAFLTAVQPIYEVVVPALTYLMNMLTKVAQAVGYLFSKLTGKSTSQMAENAKNLYDQANATEAAGNAAEKAKKQLAGFDQINKLNDNSSSGSSGSSDSIAADFNYEQMEEIDLEKLIVYSSGALLVLGIILAFTGVNIPLGIGLIAIGAVGLATEIATNWNSMSTELENTINVCLGILAVGGLVVGAILAFTGANLPLGIALMVIGAAALATEIALNWNAITEKLQGPLGKAVAIVSGALLVLGIILCFAQVWPIAIGLLVAGAAGLAAVAAVNWDVIKQKITAVFAGILAIISGAAIVLGVLLCLTGAGLGLGLALIFAGLAGTKKAWSLDDNPVTRFVKNLANGVIGIINSIADAINNLFHIKFNGLKIGGVQVIPAFNTQLLKLPKIPKLAQGAVIPPNNEFMAVLGDQKHGTNIEAPLATIQQAVAEVLGDQMSGMMAGFEALLAENRRLRATVEGIEVGDRTIGQAAARYQARLAIMEGGL